MRNKFEFPQKGEKGYIAYLVIMTISSVLYISFISLLIISVIYDMIVKASTGTFTDLTIPTTLLTLIGSVFFGTWFGKKLDMRNIRRTETYKEVKELSCKIISLMSDVLSDSVNTETKNELKRYTNQSKLFFNNTTIEKINLFLENPSEQLLSNVVNEMQKELR